MLSGTIAIRGAGYAVHNGTANKVVDGKPARNASHNDAGGPTDEKIPIKILQVSDLHSGLKVDLVFTEDDFANFVEAMRDCVSQIIRPARSATALRFRDVRGNGS